MQFVATVNLMGMTYDEIKAKCFRERRLFEDHEFHADDSSLYYAPTPEPSGKYIWRRPKEIANSFTFFTKEYIPGVICHICCSSVLYTCSWPIVTDRLIVENYK